MKKSQIIALTLVFSSSWAGAEPYPIAGLTPWQRPEAAPKIVKVERSPAAEAAIFSGISKPLPPSILPQSSDQGNWYTPFNRAGMPGYYDIRGLHVKKRAKKT